MGAARSCPVYPTGERGRPPYPLALRLRIHCVQLFYNLSDPAMEDALYDSVAVQRFVGLTNPRPDESWNGTSWAKNAGPATAGRPIQFGGTAPRRATRRCTRYARDEGAHRGGRGLVHSVATTAANVATSAAAPAWGRDARVGRRRLCGRGPAPRAPGAAGRLAGGAATGAAAALPQRRRPGGATHLDTIQCEDFGYAQVILGVRLLLRWHEAPCAGCSELS